MGDLANPTDRFSGLAGVYARHRPEYPTAALDFVLAHCGLEPGHVLVDVGSGTGICSRQFAARGLQVIGIEPNAAMRAEAEREPAPTAPIPPLYRAGRAEATGLPDQSADAVLAAQAFHWFAPEPTLAEFHRLLKPHGWAIIFSYERDETDAFTAAYGQALRSTPEGVAVETQRLESVTALLHSPLFQHGQRAAFGHEQILTEEELLGRARSVSYAPKGPAFAETLHNLFGRFQKHGKVVLRYETSVIVAKRPE